MAKHNILTFVIGQKWPATESMTLRKAQHQFWFLERLFGKCYSALGWGSLESIGRGSFTVIKVKSNRCLPRLGSRLSAFTWNKQLSAWLLLNIHYFPFEVLWLKPDQPGRWLRPWLHATANSAIGHLRPVCTCTCIRLDASMHTTVYKHIDFVYDKSPPADTTHSAQPNILFINIQMEHH